MLGVFFVEVGERIHGVAGHGQRKLYVAGLQLVIIADGKVNQIVAVLVVQQAGAFLKRILGRNDKPHSVQIGILGHVIGQDQMPDVDGIEGAEKETDFQLLNY